MFTRQTLRHLATSSSFERGEAYYDEGNVKKLRRDGDGFAATVRGSRGYRVALHLLAAGPAFTCNCPYELGGICKHAAALGLAVLDAYGSELAAAPAAPQLTDMALARAVQTAWQDRKKRDKLRFLKEALAKSDDLAWQFLAYGQPTPVRSLVFLKAAGRQAKHLSEKRKCLDFSPKL